MAAECSTVRITWTSDKEVKPYGYSISGISAYPRHGEEIRKIMFTRIFGRYFAMMISPMTMVAEISRFSHQTKLIIPMTVNSYIRAA